MPAIFINYRVGANHADADVLYDELSRRFGDGSVFLASRSIRPGDQFDHVIDDALRQCDVLLAIVGPGWAVTNQYPRPDWVHFEINSMLRQNKKIIPIVIEDAKMPDYEDLPRDIKDFANIHSLSLRHYTLAVDLARIAHEVEQAVPALRGRKRNDAAKDSTSTVDRGTATVESQDRSGAIFNAKSHGNKNTINQAYNITNNERGQQ